MMRELDIHQVEPPDKKSLLRWCLAEIEKLRKQLAEIESSADRAKRDAEVLRIKKNLFDLSIVLENLKKPLPERPASESPADGVSDRGYRHP